MNNRVGLTQGFEVDAYLKHLIDAINAQTQLVRVTSLAVLTTGLYLVSLIYSTSDREMFLGAKKTLATLNVEISLPVTFTIAPLVFLFLHTNALIQYRQLAKKITAFVDEVRRLEVPYEDRLSVGNPWAVIKRIGANGVLDLLFCGGKHL